MIDFKFKESHYKTIKFLESFRDSFKDSSIPNIIHLTEDYDSLDELLSYLSYSGDLQNKLKQYFRTSSFLCNNCGVPIGYGDINHSKKDIIVNDIKIPIIDGHLQWEICGNCDLEIDGNLITNLPSLKFGIYKESIFNLGDVVPSNFF